MKKKTLLTTILELTFTILIILSLVYIRHQSINYLEEIQSNSAAITEIEQTLMNQNLTDSDKQEIDSQLTTLEKTLDKAIILLQIILPIALFILSLFFFYPIWYLISKISVKRFLAYALIPLILLLTTIFFSLNYIAYRYFFIDENPIGYLVISAVLLFITYYTAIFGLSIKAPFKKVIKKTIKCSPKIILQYLGIIITNIAYIVFIFYIFFLTYVEAPIIIPSIMLFFIILLINIQRVYLVKKIFK